MRQRRAGVVVNVTSSVTLRSPPLLSVYTASKAAVNAFTESLALELAAFDVRARLVLPGAHRGHALPTTPARAWPIPFPNPMRHWRRQCSRISRMSQITHAEDVAEAVLAGRHRPGRPDAHPGRGRCPGLGGGGLMPLLRPPSPAGAAVRRCRSGARERASVRSASLIRVQPARAAITRCSTGRWRGRGCRRCSSWRAWL
jgi:hypothetical protein